MTEYSSNLMLLLMILYFRLVLAEGGESGGRQGDGGSELVGDTNASSSSSSSTESSEANAVSVADAAVQLLIDLQLQLAPTMDIEHKKTVWKAFIDACMNWTQRALLLAESNPSEAELLAGRAMTLLTRFLQQVKIDPVNLGNSFFICQKSGKNWSKWNNGKRSLTENQKRVNILTGGKGLRFYCYKKDTDTFAVLRDRIAADIGVSPNRVAMKGSYHPFVDFTVAKVIFIYFVISYD